VLVVAHRGASHQARENTLAAYTRAIELGADGVELDVHRSADDELVVHHDATVTGFGLIAAQPFAALRAHDAEIPTLAETFDIVGDMTLVNVEMKCCAWDADPDPGRVVARGVAALLASRGRRDNVVVSSFDLAMMDDLRAIDDRLTTGWLVSRQDPVAAAATAARHGHAWLHPDWGHLAANLDASVVAAAGHGIRLDPWTIDEPAVIVDFARAGVDAVITNEPDVALAALGG
jgi:glycerophosphoryl diester phosphodiesterase